MAFIYNILITLTSGVLKGVSVFNTKIKKGVNGRKQTFKILKETILKTDKCIWFHCASLGEYEQGLPVFKEIRKLYPKHKIVLSFFSPSGYEIRKHTEIANIVIYLPLDTKRNAKKFIDLVQPELTVFVKYDIWPNFLKELKKRNLKAILISALFRPSHSFFKFYGKEQRNALFAFNHIFVQNEASKMLLKKINYTDVTVSGDTRFDRVYSQLEQNNTLDFIEEFKQDSLCIIAGSTWPEDENILIDYINNNASNKLKFIIAPHNIKTSQIDKFCNQLQVPFTTFSKKENKDLSTFSVFIMDTIGLLTKAYSYADIAYVGGAMGKTGLHNTLEPAVFGIPIIIGKNYKKFPEAYALLAEKGMFSVKNKKELSELLDELTNNQAKRKKTGAKNFNYIKKNKEAVIQIINYIRK
ncbi:3-deoxy-D-manno-octulosonic acid transferase [Lacinutrix sp. C3R15]|uniref:3-deoxy-D-manno-octulosonic acid transferase n=1 Tax=Flavobacteriaceae TaxID=49546 RepID=UPI001C0A4CB1|nr:MULTISPECIES: glycosyltransferase N-terminal domain-containing protein [Flavobacteriaceae]MBU2940010.1 3-deoxy-D-manno-octulosonic acid transferase [Lacinutrix sp. C3R15]MDO6623327.1 glycosyltransferase N-terminal domain-containing protein [Oceanihabitans sp. 1_MG-2023]